MTERKRLRVVVLVRRDAEKYEVRGSTSERRAREYSNIRQWRPFARALSSSQRDRNIDFRSPGTPVRQRTYRGRRVRGWLKYNAPCSDRSSPTRLVPRLACPPPRSRYADWPVDGGVRCAAAIRIGSRADRCAARASSRSHYLSKSHIDISINNLFNTRDLLIFNIYKYFSLFSKI